MNKKMIISGLVLTAATIGQIALSFLFYDPEGSVILINIGWFILMLSAFFGWLPIFTFRRKGKITGKSYVHTSVLVDTGIYSIVRHPQYLAGILINLALPMISLHWSVIALGLIGGAVNYINTFDEEQGCLEKFGDDYSHYMAKVPRLNFIAGIVREIRRRIE